MTSPAWVWVARIELAFSRFQTERSTIEPHPCTGSGGRGRTFVARFKAACPTVGRLRNIGCCGRSRTFARGLMRPGILRGAQRCKKKSGDKEGGDVACCSAAELAPGGARRAGVEPATRKVHVVPSAFTAGKR